MNTNGQDQEPNPEATEALLGGLGPRKPSTTDVPAQIVGQALSDLNLSTAGTAGLIKGLLFYEADPEFWTGMMERWANPLGENLLAEWRQIAERQSQS